MITVKYFASLRERLGKAEDRVDAATLSTVEDVWKQATGNSPSENVLCAVNQEYASINTQVSDGDEIAFFPPVTGG